MADSIQSETNFSVSKLSKDEPSILMCLHLVLFAILFSVHVRQTTLTNSSIATDCHNFKKNGKPSYIVTLATNKLFVHISYWSLPRLNFF